MQRIFEEKFQTKEMILRIAFKLFMERGFVEVSISELIKAAGITKKRFYYHFDSKDQLICEIIEKLFLPYFNDIIEISSEDDDCSKDRFQKIFQRYAEIKHYLQNNLGIRVINYRSIIGLMVEGIKDYKATTNYIVDFNNRLLEKIEYVINEGQLFGEISSQVESKFISKYTFTLLQNSLVLWVMNQNIDIKKLFEVNFKYLWNKIKSPESNLVILDNNIMDNSADSKLETDFYIM